MTTTTIYVTHRNDAAGMQAIGLLEELGYEIRQLTGEGACCLKGEVALFSCKQGGSFPSSFLRTVSHDFERRGIRVPEWARGADSMAAIRTARCCPIAGTFIGRDEAGFKEALVNYVGYERPKRKRPKRQSAIARRIDRHQEIREGILA
ncbi:MAG TPA: hypothetical protein VHO23_03000 [Candidatus Paceibacterota bacterium]|nr:hypothetical protein [Candidatus Paceibacterota bacterium]